ncbi:integrase [Pseudomonas chlororaphis]|uniref:Tyrosine-type recombinase/integrase n=1 Tax=Pseudomonas chlororaphis TaxID=587753 RepID=A0AAQ0AR40_9PSED|nr:tyrosine-type recombinase/integrase [Pseudomonas chlororaphis]AUG39677.1 integrase [Pseudomonas chlororaphis]QNR49271.1 tyrosine-type recombinase/integrase [Pseudomonas chlororaphis]
MANNLELQGGTYHVRLAIPADVQKAFGGRRVLSQTLMTGVYQEALDRRLPILAAWKAQIKIAREGKPLPEGWQENLLSGLLELESLKRNRKLNIIGEPTAPLTVSESEVEAFKAENPRFVALLERVVDYEWDNSVEGELRIQEGLHRAFKKTIQNEFASMHRLSSDEHKELAGLINNPKSYTPKSPITKARLAAFRTFRENRNIAAKTIDQQQSKLEKLSAYLTQTGNPLDFDTISSWLDSINLASKTLTQYLLAGNVFWKWAMKHDARWRVDYKDKANPFEEHDLPKVRGKDRADAQRKDFTLDDLPRLHAAAISEGLTALADLILLGTYTGARIEELCQLKTENVIVIDGVQCFDITDSKTKAGIRVVPIHPAIAGVVKRLMDDSKDNYLVVTNSRSKYGIRSDPMVKAFGRLKSSLGFGPDRVFHSIRKTTITQLVRANVQGTLIAELVGHETGQITFDVYSQGASISQKFEAISKMPILKPACASGA